jgi:hypothetical protein
MPKHANPTASRGAKWHEAHKFPTICKKCGKEGEKNTMHALYTRKSGYDTPRILCRLCPECMAIFMDELDIEIPD